MAHPLMLCPTNGEYVFPHRSAYIVSYFYYSAAQIEFMKSQYLNLSGRNIHFQSVINIHIDVIIIIRKIFTLFAYP